MINLHKKLQQKKNNVVTLNSNNVVADARISVRDKLLVKEIQEMEQNMPRSCRVTFDDPHKLYQFILTVSPDEGYWQAGRFRFHVTVPEDYNIVPPSVKCETKIWHPNITEDGEVCLSLLRQNSLDAHGWAPTRKMKDLVWGLASLFSDLLNFDDPLNVEAADHFSRDKEGFISKVKEYVQRYAKR